MSGYRNSAGTDTDALFTAGNAGITTGYRRSDGVDLGSIYHPYTLGAKRAATGIRNSAGVDLSDLFQNSDVPLFSVSLAGGMIASHYRTGGCTVGFYLENDARIAVTKTGETTTYPYTWGTPTGGTPGTGYYGYMTQGSGGYGQNLGGLLNAWRRIDTGVYGVLSSGVGECQRNLLVYIATDAAGSNIIASASVWMEAGNIT